MDPQHVNDVVARVVAWHNRHPLAWRIAPGHVAGVGLVALPFHATGLAPADATPDPGAADELGTAPTAPMLLHPDRRAIDDDALRAALRGPIATRLQPLLRRMRRRAPQPDAIGRVRLLPAYSEDFIPPLLPRETARWALRHGWTRPPGEPGWPCREVQVDPDLDAPDGAELTTLYLMTAAVEFGGYRLRLLIGRGRTPPVCGARALNRGRLAGAAGGLVLAGTAGALLTLRPAWLDAVPTLLARADRSTGPDAATHEASPPASAPPVQAHDAASAAAHAPHAPGSAPTEAHEAILTERADGAPVPEPSVDPAERHETLDPGADLRRRRAAAYAAARSAKAGQGATPAVPAVGANPAATSKPKTGTGTEASPPGKPGSATAVAAAQAAPSAAELEPHEGQDDEVDAEPLVHILPTLSPAARHAARVEAAALRGQDPDSLAIGRPLRRGTAAAAPGAKPSAGDAAAGAPGSDRLYALVTRRTATRVESEALLVTLRVAVARDDTPMPKRQDLLEVENGWQAAWWPFKSRDEAERARRLLATRGLQLEVVDF